MPEMSQERAEYPAMTVPEPPRTQLESLPEAIANARNALVKEFLDVEPLTIVAGPGAARRFSSSAELRELVRYAGGGNAGDLGMVFGLPYVVHPALGDQISLVPRPAIAAVYPEQAAKLGRLERVRVQVKDWRHLSCSTSIVGGRFDAEFDGRVHAVAYWQDRSPTGRATVERLAAVGRLKASLESLTPYAVDLAIHVPSAAEFCRFCMTPQSPPVVA